MPYLFTLIVILFLTGCVSPSSGDNRAQTEKRQETPQLEGNYTLEKGLIVYSKSDISINKTINSSNLVIEKLDENDFGFYYTTQIEDRYRGKYFGIFHYKDGKFYQKVIEDKGEVSLLGNLELIQEENRLKLTVNTNHGKRILIWGKEPKMVITKELKEVQESYIKFCKEKYMKIEKD